MKPQDLRIGNYVRIKESGRIVQVEAIMRSGIGIKNSINIEPTGRAYSEIEPVLIREVYDSLPTITDLTWCDKALCEDLYYYKDIPLTDLHQLQNIHYALTGNEIEIEI